MKKDIHIIPARNILTNCAHDVIDFGKGDCEGTGTSYCCATFRFVQEPNQVRPLPASRDFFPSKEANSHLYRSYQFSITG